MLKLPPLNALKAFASVAKYQSIKQAANDLHVTHSAVSQQIKLLENYLGVKLIRKSGVKIKLTPKGRSYANDITEALNAMHYATEQLVNSDNPTILRVNVRLTFAMYWLIPRLHHFQTQHPEIEIHTVTTWRNAHFSTENVDAAIYHGDGNWPELHSDFLFGSFLVPVCSPELAKAHPIQHPEDMRHLPTIYVDSEQHQNDWKQWYREFNLEEPSTAHRIYFQYIFQALQGAISGLGLAMGYAPFVDADIQAGRLVAPISHRIESKNAYYFVCPPSHLKRKKVKLLQKWLLTEAKPPT